ncbi:Na+/H+ antiporter subunit D [candidate division KSB1 bacterium]|nr:Na+/H+ antiporter subunit D [candidate division KSB1 bacterium]
MNVLIISPVIIPFTTAIILLLLFKLKSVQRYISLIGSLVSLGISISLLVHTIDSGILSVQIGNWPAPYGITIVSDLFSAIMVVMTALMSLTVNIYSMIDIDTKRIQYGYFPLINILLMGVNGAFLTGDIFNLYVWFEVMLMSSFVLMVLGGERKQMEGAVKYVTLNLISSALFLAGLGILYGEIGTLNMADIAYTLRATADATVTGSTAMLFFIAFGIKAAIFPLFFWLPASYHTPPASVSALFAGLLTKVGVYSLIRSFTLFFVQDATFFHEFMIIIAGFTMLTGVLGAASQFEFRRVLSFHIISQIGYMIMGLGIFTPLAIAGSIFFLIHNMITKTNLFFISGVVYRLKGSYELKKLGGLYASHPWLSIFLVISAFSLAGLPPLSGFWAKFALIKAGLQSQDYPIVFIALFVSMLTLFSMVKIWAEAFWKKQPSQKNDFKSKLSARDYIVMIIPIGMLALLAVAIGIGFEPLMNICMKAASQLLNPELYIQSILGGYPK